MQMLLLMLLLLLLLARLQINVAVEFKRSILFFTSVVVPLTHLPCLSLPAPSSGNACDSASGRVPLCASLETQLPFLCSLHVVIVR